METNTLPEEQVPQSKMKLMIIVAAAIVLLLIIILVIVAKLKTAKAPANPGQSLQSLSPTPLPDTLIASVGGKKILYKDLQNTVSQLYGKAPVTSQEKQAILDESIEREILDQAAAKLGITVSDSTLQQMAKYKFPQKNGEALSQNELDATKYDYLRTQITAREVASRLAFVIAYWLPSDSYPETIPADKKPLYEKQRQEGKVAIDEIEKRIKNNEPPLNVARSIIANPAYSDLKSILGLNGYVVDGNNDINLFINPKPYVYQTDIDSKLFYDTLFSMKENTVQTLREDEGPGSGSKVIKLVSISDGKYKTYDDWLADQKKQLVKTQ